MNLYRKLFRLKLKISSLIRRRSLVVVSLLIIFITFAIGLFMYMNESQNATILTDEDGKRILVFGGKDYIKMRNWKRNDNKPNPDEKQNDFKSLLKRWRLYSKYQTSPEYPFHLVKTVPSTTIACESPIEIERPNHLSEDTSNWQTVGSDDLTYVYSAYIDVGLPPYQTGLKVLIIGITRDYYSMALRRKHGLCVLWFKESSVPIYVESDINILPESHEMRYSASYHTCDFDHATLGIPYAVSLVFSKCDQPTNLLQIKHTSDISKYPSGPNPQPIEKQSKVSKFKKKIDQSISNSHYSIEKQNSNDEPRDFVNFTVCVTPVNREFNDYRQIVEMIEMNRIFGAQRIAFYDYSTGNDVRAVLNNYVREGLVEVLPWNLPLMADKASNNEPPIHYFGQLAALNDCLHRNKLRSRFIVFSDIDELLVPRMRETWAELIDDVSHRRQIDLVTSRIVYAPVYAVQNVFFRGDWGNYTNIKNIELIGKLNLRTLLTANRESKIYPHDIRSKYIVNPRLVRMVGVHFVYELSRESETNFEIEVLKDDALLHHYRREMWANDPNSTPIRVEDKYMHRYARKLVHRVAIRMKRLGYLNV